MKLAAGNPETVAILAPHGRDAAVIAGVLGEDGIEAHACDDLPSLARNLETSGLAVVTDEALLGADLAPLTSRIAEQAEWSDYPFILLTRRGGGPERNPAALRQMQALGNVSFLERPFHPMTFVSLARTGLASRRRQYQARDRLAALEASRSEIARSDERLKFTLSAGDLGAWELAFPGRELTVTDICKGHLGLPADEPLPFSRLLDIIHPEDRPRVLKEAQAAIDSRQDYGISCRILTAADETRWVEIRGRATYENGRANRMAGVSLNVTERKRADERQNLLIRELHHRVKNTLSTVQAIVGSTARGATTIDDFYRDFTGRIMSLANTHTILTEELWQRASLHELLGKELDLYDTGKERVQVAGPPIELPSDYAVPLGMAFHELTTNAAKYGALSNGRGRVSVTWSLESDRAAPRVHLRWVEEGGPPVAKPTRQGFGTRLLDRVLTAQVKAEVGLDYDPRGLRVSVAFDLPDRPAGAAPKGWA